MGALGLTPHLHVLVCRGVREVLQASADDIAPVLLVQPMLQVWIALCWLFFNQAMACKIALAGEPFLAS